MPAKREEGEKLSDFISRFMSNKRDDKKYPDVKQRLALGYSDARERSKKEKHHV
jgi:hypothetical protein